MSFYPQFKTLGDICSYHGAAHGTQVAMLSGKRVSTYTQLDQHANQVANGLSQRLQTQQRVAVLAKNNDYFFEVLMGASKCAAVVVGVNWRLAAPEVETILQDSEARVLFIDEEFLPLLERIRPGLPLLQEVLVFYREKTGEGDDYCHWRLAQADIPLEVAPAPEDIVLQLYTSGTTGHPKGVQLSNAALLSLREAEHRIGGWSRSTSDDVFLVSMPVFHIGGAATGLIALYNGAKMVLVEEVDPGRIISLIESEKVTRTFLVPAAIQLLLDHPDCRPEAFSSLKILLYGASPIPAALLQRALGVMRCGFAQLYGMTETAGSMTVLEPHDHADPAARKMTSCGRPYPGIEIAIADAHGRHLPPDTVGEIIIRSPSLMRGYWRRPEATEETIRNGWLYSGDAGYLDDEGYLYIYDRVKDMIVSGGENVYPAEVESVLYSHPAVQDVAVIGVPSERWGEEVKAVVVIQSGARLSDRELISYAREQIAGYKVPKTVDFVEALPRNASGKLLKKDIRAPYWAGMDRQIN
jgi:acyl-CoA synthetase (AMP-forming)/AMP-acid ligase II